MVIIGALITYSFKKGCYKRNNMLLKIFSRALKLALKILKYANKKT